MAARWAIHPSSEEAAFLLEAAIIYREARNFQAARDILEGVRALFPKHEVPEIIPRSAYAHAHFGEVCLFRKDKDGARKHLKNSVALDPLGEYGKMARKLMELTDKANFS